MLVPLQSVVEALIDRRVVTSPMMEQAVGAVMDGLCDPIEIAALITSLRFRDETVDMVVGAANAMRARSSKVRCRSAGLLDTCGTGGDSLHTFNISTATAIVAAAAGAHVAKHGNRSASSKSGSADVLEALGVNIGLTPEQAARCVDELGIGFCFAPRLHAAMKYAAPVRQKLGFRTLFNLLGPLTNPAGAQFQLVGTGKNRLAEVLAKALVQLGTDRALVVCGNDELDEVSLWGTTQVFVVEGSQLHVEEWTPESFGLPTCRVSDLTVDSPAQSAERIQGVLRGDAGPARDMVLANTAAALIAARLANDPRQGVAKAAAAIDSGKALQTLSELARRTSELAAVG